MSATPSNASSPDARAELAAALWPDPLRMSPKVLECRHCGKRNRVQVPSAIMYPERCLCGSCDKPLFLAPDEPLTAISSSAYEHSLDRKALQALKAVPGFTPFLRWVLSNLGERSMKLMNLSSSVQCGDDQFPELVRLLDKARQRLDIPYKPSLFLTDASRPNAATFGVEEPTLMVYSPLLDGLDDTEVVSVLAHELGHLHADHSLYRVLAQVLASGVRLFGSVGQLLSFPLQKALYKWHRCSELTADRAGLLGCRDMVASLKVMLKLAGGHRPGTTSRTQMRLAPFIRQARQLAELEDSSLWDGVLAALMTMDNSHPFIAWRVMHLIEWVEHGNYLDILAGQYARVERPKQAA